MCFAPWRRGGFTLQLLSMLPERIKPMLAEMAEKPFDSKQHLFEIKWDGIRCLAFVGEAKVHLQNRRLSSMTERYPELQVLREWPPGTILDGEMVVLHEGMPSFNRLAQREHIGDSRRVHLLKERLPATYIAFDLLYENGQSIMREPLVERRKRLKAMAAGFSNPHIVIAEYIIQRGKRYYEEVERVGLEGIMAKRIDSLYTPGARSTAWLKLKVCRTGDFELIGYTKREGEETASALVLAERVGEELMYCGRVGSGFTEAKRRELYKQIIGTPRLGFRVKDVPREAVLHNTGWKCRVRFQERTEDGCLRSPVFVQLVKE
jgi:bifunctional non-homologous end joining protein LigD